MSTFLAGLLAIALWLVPTSAALAAPVAPELGVLPGLRGVFTGAAPELGVHDGTLPACPESPNCWVSQGDDEAHRIEPIEYSRDRDTVRDLLVKVLGVVPRTEVVT